MSILTTWTEYTGLSGCGDVIALPALPADPDCVLPPGLSQVNYVYIQPDGATDPFDYSGGDPTAVSGAIGNTTSGNSTSKSIGGIGDVPEAEEVIYNGKNRIRQVVSRRYRLNFTVNLKEDGMYDLCLRLQSGWRGFKFRYADLDGDIYGGAASITPAFANAIMPKGRGEEDIKEGTLQLEWVVEDGQGDPPKHPNPLA